jgi:gamma-glutamyltranspeptidase / glutathione hydrolase
MPSIHLQRVVTLLTTVCLAAAPAAMPAAPRLAHVDDQDHGPKFGAVATVHPLATDAAMNALRNGGNAVDASVAAMLTLGVVDNPNSGIGGGCFMLIRLANGETYAIDGRETAPSLATRDMYLRDGKADPNLSQTGALAVGVPGALATYDEALKRFGKHTLADALLPAADIAERGFAINANYAGKIRATREKLMAFPASAAVVLKADGSPYEAGETIVQKDLAATYRAIAKDGIGYFYAGDFAKKVDSWMVENSGLLRAGDFAAYKPRSREPIISTYRGRTIIGFPPPSSGGVHVAQILSMLDHFEVVNLSEADRTTAIANAMNLAFADRAHWLGDPDFAEVPRGLLDPDYIVTRVKLLKTNQAIDIDHGDPPKVDPEFFSREAEKHTTHVAVADAAGNVVSVTATINTSFGSKVIVPGTGVFLNNEMDDFSAQPGVPNAFKLIGAEANAIGPGKRPLSSMSPTIVLENGEVRYVIGAAGGPKIITQVVNVLSNLIDRRLSPEEAMRAPRIHHQWRPDHLWIENTASPSLIEALKARGFTLDIAAPNGATNMVEVEGKGSMTAVSEPRLEGKAAAE